MDFRAAEPADSAAIEAFLVARSDTSMFLRANLASHGPCGGEARNATQMWIRGSDTMVTGVFGLTTAGFVLVQIPDDIPGEEIAAILSHSEINGIFGATEQVRRMQAILGLEDAKAQLDDDEPLYALGLADLSLPESAASLRQATESDRDLLVGWRTAYLVETLHFSLEDAEELAVPDVEGMLEKQSLMILETPDGRPVAMTSFNAILPDTVQVGNVYTPGEVRGQGYARRAVALHLDRARRDGAKRAILFASGPAASRAYEAIGFRQVGRFTLLFFAVGQSVRAAA